jgi:hypothetical protein
MLVCCPRCFEPLRVQDRECPNCRNVLSADIFETLRDTAFEATVYGWAYRRKYETASREGENAEGEIAVRYAIQPPADWLSYLGSVALAAIIGGVVYDSFKIILSRISATFHRHFHRKLPSDKWLRLFYNNLKEYMIGKRNPNSIIFEAYVKNGTKCAILMASAEDSPKAWKEMDDISRQCIKTLDGKEVGEGVELSLPDAFFAKEPSRETIERKNKELTTELRQREKKLVKLQNYLAKQSDSQKQEKPS